MKKPLLRIFLILFMVSLISAVLTDDETSFGIAVSEDDNTILEEVVTNIEIEATPPVEEKLVGIFDKCEHKKMSTVFSFQFENSVATSYFKPYCKNCNHYFGYTLFRGTPNDLSYLEAVRQYIDESDIKSGEYYTMIATVSLADYDINRARIRCKVENEDIIVGFSVEFRGEFEEQVSLIREGDEITFSGRLYDEGFGWTDCELL